MQSNKDDNIRNIKNAANTLRNEARDAIDETSEDVKGTLYRAGDKVRHLFLTARNEINHASDSVSSQIRRKPVQSSLAALGIGFVIGALLRR